MVQLVECLELMKPQIWPPIQYKGAPVTPAPGRQEDQPFKVPELHSKFKASPVYTKPFIKFEGIFLVVINMSYNLPI